MKKIFTVSLIALAMLVACNNKSEKNADASTSDAPSLSTGQEGVQDDVSQKDIVKIAVGSKDHTTLVAALKQADYVNDLSNAGPFTVFAPTDEAFKKLPDGVLAGLMKDDKIDDLRNILEYHVALPAYKPEYLQDGQTIGMANSDNITLSIKDGKTVVNGTANVVATIPATNGIIYVVDAVLLPPAKK